MTLAWLLAAFGAGAMILVGASARWHERASGARGRLLATTLGWACLIGSLLLLDLAVPSLVNTYIWQIIIKVGIYVTLAVSLNIINGIAGQFSMGHAGFMAVGAYTAAYLTMTLGAGATGWVRALPWNGPWSAFAGSGVIQNAPLGLGRALIFLLALVAGGIAAAIAGYIVGIPSLRLRGDYLAIVTLGFGEIIRNLIANVEVIGASRGLPGVPHYSGLFWVFLFAAISIFVSYRLLASAPGRAMLAVREDEVAAAAMGIDTTRTKIQAFAIGTFFAGIAGGLLGHHFEYLHPDYFKFDKSFEVIIMVVLGGMGSVSGATVAAVVIALAPEVLRYAKDLLGNLTEPAVLYATSPFILYSLLAVVLFAADLVRLLVRGAGNLRSALRLRAGGRLGAEDLERLRGRGGRSLISLPSRAVASAPTWARDAGLGAVAGIAIAAAHRGLVGTAIDPRAEYWIALLVGAGAGVGLGLWRAARQDAPTTETIVRTDLGRPAPDPGWALPPRRLTGLAAVGLIAPLALATAWMLETGAPDFLARASNYFRYEMRDPRMVLYSIMLVALMLTRPKGLFGTSEIRTWWREHRASKQRAETHA